MAERPPAASVGEVVELFRVWAEDRYDEEVTQRAHAEQCAALAVAAGASDQLVVAALLHDVGHLVHLADGRGGPGGRDRAHQSIGARYLDTVFGPAVTVPIALHVDAKRYRCATDPRHEATLSEGSRASLALQGGPATRSEIAQWDSTPGFSDALALRAWDDSGKVDGLVVAPFERYVELLERVARP